MWACICVPAYRRKYCLHPEDKALCYDKDHNLELTFLLQILGFLDDVGSQTNRTNFAVEQLAFMLRMREVRGTHLDPKTGQLV
jgi:hypothetical protein